jgi:hypothetical protein
MEGKAAKIGRIPILFAGFATCVFLVSLLLIGCGSATDRTLEQTIEQNYPVDPTASISVSNRDGSIRIYGADTPRLKLQAIKKAYTAERLNGISVNVSAQPHAVSIETTFPPKKGWGFSDRSGTVDYTLVVPQNANIPRLELANGEVLVEGMRGQNARARLGSGRLFAHNCFGNLDLGVTTGNLAIVYEWWEQATFSLRANIADGNGFAFIPSDASFHLMAETVTGKIANDFTEKEERRGQEPTKIDMLVGGDGKTTIEIRVADGNIKISEANP